MTHLKTSCLTRQWYIKMVRNTFQYLETGHMGNVGRLMSKVMLCGEYTHPKKMELKFKQPFQAYIIRSIKAPLDTQEYHV